MAKYANLNHRNKENSMTRQRIELIGRVNKIRQMDKRPSKTVAAAQTLSRAVNRAFIQTMKG
jgi:hypothetical protein